MLKIYKNLVKDGVAMTRIRIKIKAFCNDNKEEISDITCFLNLLKEEVKKKVFLSIKIQKVRSLSERLHVKGWYGAHRIPYFIIDRGFMRVRKINGFKRDKIRKAVYDLAGFT